MVVLRYIGVPLFIHRNSCGFDSPSCSLGSLSFFPAHPHPSYLDHPFLFLSHLHRALRMCLCAMTRTIEYPTFVRSSFFFLRSTLLVRIDSPTSRPTLFPPSLTLRSRTNVDAKEVSLNEWYLRTLWVSLLLASTLSLRYAATKREPSGHYGDWNTVRAMRPFVPFPSFLSSVSFPFPFSFAHSRSCNANM